MSAAALALGLVLDVLGVVGSEKFKVAPGEKIWPGWMRPGIIRPPTAKNRPRLNSYCIVRGRGCGKVRELAFSPKDQART